MNDYNNKQDQRKEIRQKTRGQNEMHHMINLMDDFQHTMKMNSELRRNYIHMTMIGQEVSALQ